MPAILKRLENLPLTDTKVAITTFAVMLITICIQSVIVSHYVKTSNFNVYQRLHSSHSDQHSNVFAPLKQKLTFSCFLSREISTLETHKLWKFQFLSTLLWKLFSNHFLFTIISYLNGTSNESGCSQTGLEEWVNLIVKAQLAEDVGTV